MFPRILGPKNHSPDEIGRRSLTVTKEDTETRTILSFTQLTTFPHTGLRQWLLVRLV